MKNYVLKYNKPAEYSENGWQNEVLPIGNGMLGMCVFGGVFPRMHLHDLNEKLFGREARQRAERTISAEMSKTAMNTLKKSEKHCAAVIKRPSLNLRISL